MPQVAHPLLPHPSTPQVAHPSPHPSTPQVARVDLAYACYNLIDMVYARRDMMAHEERALAVLQRTALTWPKVRLIYHVGPSTPCSHPDDDVPLSPSLCGPGDGAT